MSQNFIVEQFTPLRKNSLLGFVTVRAPSGLIFHDAAVMRKGDSIWVAPAAKPLLGRTFSEAEGNAGGPEAVLLSEGLWRGTFHADLNILGRVVKVSGISRAVVGVMPVLEGPRLSRRRVAVAWKEFTMLLLKTNVFISAMM